MEPSSRSESTALVHSLEDLLVKEFRLCQALHALTQEERQALSLQDVPAVSRLIEHKEALLDEMAQLEDQRRGVAQELGGQLGLAVKSSTETWPLSTDGRPRTDTPSIAELAGAMRAVRLPSHTGGLYPAAERLLTLREGIVALAGQIQELTSGNRALAVSALERVDALQTFLLDLYKPNLYYTPPGAPAHSAESVAWGVDQRT
jgi:hypothetical protein